jgi:Asp/Glu/hydantoin racemase
MSGMRLVWHVGVARHSHGRMAEPELLWDALAQFAAGIVNPDTKVDFRFLERSTASMVHPYQAMVSSVALVEDVLKCEQEGYDAVMLAPAIDPALDEARGAARIPVVASVEAALAISQFIGRRVGIIAVRAGYATIIDQNVSRYRLRDRMIANRPVRHWDMDYRYVTRALQGDGDEFLSQFEGVADELIDDGADVVIGGCQLFGPILEKAGFSGVFKSGVPYIDCGAAGLKMTETLASVARTLGIKKSESPFSPFRSMDPSLLSEAAAVLAP